MDASTEHKRRTKELERQKAENALLSRQAAEAEKGMEEAAGKLSVGQDALLFLEKVANSRRGAMRSRIEDVVTEALRLLYGPDYSVELTYSMKNNRSCLDIELVRAAKVGEVRRGMGGFGVGVADTISVPLRLMVLIGSKQTDRVCLLDECWKHVDPERVELVGQFIRVLSGQLGIQIILCSHHEALRDKADKTYLVSEDGGRSDVRSET
jgi:hypothetical protein